MMGTWVAWSADDVCGLTISMLNERTMATEDNNRRLFDQTCQQEERDQFLCDLLCLLVPHGPFLT
jgi:hypothetical protein